MTVSLTLIRLMAFCLWAWNMKWKNFWCLLQCPKYKQSHTKKKCGSEISHKIGQNVGLWTTWKGIKGKSFLFWKVCLDYEHCSLKIFLQGIWQLSLWNQPPRNCATLYVYEWVPTTHAFFFLKYGFWNTKFFLCNALNFNLDFWIDFRLEMYFLWGRAIMNPTFLFGTPCIKCNVTTTHF